MEGFNRIISLLVGLFVVIMVFFFITKQLKLNEKWPILGGTSAEPTPTITKQVAQKTVTVNTTTTTTSQTTKDKTAVAKLPKDSVYNQKHTTTSVKTPAVAGTETKGVQTTSATSIPNTGLPTFFLPSVLTGLLSGFYLKRKTS